MQVNPLEYVEIYGEDFTEICVVQVCEPGLKNILTFWSMGKSNQKSTKAVPNQIKSEPIHFPYKISYKMLWCIYVTSKCNTL